jgi:opacity protein-like surface antigen
MKTYLAAALVSMAIAGGAQASSHNPAIKSPKPIATPTAAKGANSFTEAQARDRIAKAGYTDVSKLVKNPNGVWQGAATKDGATVQIGLDYRGNVIKR